MHEQGIFILRAKTHKSDVVNRLRGATRLWTWLAFASAPMAELHTSSHSTSLVHHYYSVVWIFVKFDIISFKYIELL